MPRLLLLAVIPVLAMLVSAQTMPEAGSVPDPDLYVPAGCAGCGGCAADDAFGPTLVATGLTFEAFLEQLRSPTGIMPPVDASRVSDEQVRSLYDYVRVLEGSGRRAHRRYRLLHPRMPGSVLPRTRPALRSRPQRRLRRKIHWLTRPSMVSQRPVWRRANGASRIRSENTSNGRACGPSLSARSGSGWISIITP